jgi:hypothetical protein
MIANPRSAILPRVVDSGCPEWGEVHVFHAPDDRCVRIPFFVGLFMVALGFLFFEAYGGLIGLREDAIIAWELQQIQAHPDVKQTVERVVATPEQAADKAWERIKFFHGHGYLMVLACFVFLSLAANAPGAAARTKARLLWVGLIAMVLYNVGWGLAGWLVPYVGAESAKEFSEWCFFVPFGLTLMIATGIVAAHYGRQMTTSLRRP